MCKCRRTELCGKPCDQGHTATQHLSTYPVYPCVFLLPVFLFLPFSCSFLSILSAVRAVVGFCLQRSDYTSGHVCTRQNGLLSFKMHEIDQYDSREIQQKARVGSFSFPRWSSGFISLSMEAVSSISLNKFLLALQLHC